MPAFVVIYGLPVKEAIATSLAVVAVMAIPDQPFISLSAT
ncbi:MAG: hypothetical protein M1455_07110 [Actinobacteria bacterium]|nr:hypothetical protein [Actinomycetota bacterium]